MPTLTRKKKPKSKKLIIPPTAVTGTVMYGNLFPIWVAKTGDTVPAIQVENDDVPADWECPGCGGTAEYDPPCAHHSTWCSSCCHSCWICEKCDNTINGDNNSLCESCCFCPNCCACSTCTGCDWKASSDSFCGMCMQCEGCCCCEEDDKGNCTCSNCVASGCDIPGCSCDSAKFGKFDYPLGWERRGKSVRVQQRKVALSEFQQIEPAKAMADFYLLSYMEHDPILNSDPGLFATEYRTTLESFCDEARNMKTELVNLLDPVFRRYVDIAVGGEVRHHRAIRHATGMSSERGGAWTEWLSIREEVGPEALADAAELFLQMGEGYGGERWATAARILFDRETGKLPAWAFVDRVFTLQHNNGSLLNKVEWAPNTGAIQGDALGVMRYIGTAHAAKPTILPVLQIMASPEVNALFRQWWKARNRLRIALGKSTQLLPSWRPFVRHEGRELSEVNHFAVLRCPGMDLLYLNKMWVEEHCHQPKPKPKPTPLKPTIIFYGQNAALETVAFNIAQKEINFVQKDTYTYSGGSQ